MELKKFDDNKSSIVSIAAMFGVPCVDTGLYDLKDTNAISLSVRFQDKNGKIIEGVYPIQIDGKPNYTVKNVSVTGEIEEVRDTVYRDFLATTLIYVNLGLSAEDAGSLIQLVMNANPKTYKEYNEMVYNQLLLKANPTILMQNMQEFIKRNDDQVKVYLIRAQKALFEAIQNKSNQKKDTIVTKNKLVMDGYGDSSDLFDEQSI